MGHVYAAPVMLLTVMGVCLGVSLPVVSAQPCSWTEGRKFVAGDPAPGDEYGYAVAIWDDRYVVGSWHDDDDGPNSGSVYIYDRATGAELFKLTADDASAGAQFGYPIKASEGIAIIGAFGDSGEAAEAGAAYLFDLTTGTQIRKIVSTDPGDTDWFGISVDISGPRATIGASQTDDNGEDSGSALIIDVATGDVVHELVASDPGAGDWFGFDTAIDGNRAIVGARRNSGAGFQAGAAYVFDVEGGAQLHRFVAPDAEPEADFGRAVAISGDLVLIGAPLTSHTGNNSGTAYVFNIATGAFVHRLVADDASPGSNFGISVSMEGTVGIIGAISDSQNGPASGAVYAFDLVTGEQIAKITPGDATPFQLFGIRTTIEDGTVLVGAWFDAHAGSGSGSAYEFELGCVTPCIADFTGDGGLDFFDVQAFLAAFSAGDLSADFTNDGELDFFDVQEFLALFSAGCP